MPSLSASAASVTGDAVGVGVATRSAFGGGEASGAAAGGGGDSPHPLAAASTAANAAVRTAAPGAHAVGLGRSGRNSGAPAGSYSMRPQSLDPPNNRRYAAARV